jgi:hypothetical protein
MTPSICGGRSSRRGRLRLQASAGVGADMPWTTYEAEGMKTTGVVLGPKYDPNLVETESSGQKCVKLVGAGEYVEFTARRMPMRW